MDELQFQWFVELSDLSTNIDDSIAKKWSFAGKIAIFCLIYLKTLFVYNLAMTSAFACLFNGFV